MTPTKVLLDTNLLIDEQYDLSRYRVAVSSLSWGELHHGIVAAADPAERAARTTRLRRLQNLFGAGLPFDDAAAEAYGTVIELVLARGRKPRSRAIDLMIAATALVHGAAVVTRNPDDFAGLESLVRVIPAS